MYATTKIRNSDELVDLILLGIGFNLPPEIEGMSTFQKLLSTSENKIKKGEGIRATMLEVFDGLNKILYDISYFYIYFLWNLDQTVSNRRIEKINKIIKKLKVSKKPFNRLTLGELNKLVRTLSSQIKKKASFKERLKKEFNRDYLLTNSQLKILDEVIRYRNKVVVHPEKKIPPSKNRAIEIIKRLKGLVQILKENKVYPSIIRIRFEIKNEYGTQYFEAEDEYGVHWTIKAPRWMYTTKLYFMHSKTNPVAINPLIIEKVF